MLNSCTKYSVAWAMILVSCSDHGTAEQVVDIGVVYSSEARDISFLLANRSDRKWEKIEALVGCSCLDLGSVPSRVDARSEAKCTFKIQSSQIGYKEEAISVTALVGGVRQPVSVIRVIASIVPSAMCLPRLVYDSISHEAESWKSEQSLVIPHMNGEHAVLAAGLGANVASFDIISSEVNDLFSSFRVHLIGSCVPVAGVGLWESYYEYSYPSGGKGVLRFQIMINRESKDLVAMPPAIIVRSGGIGVIQLPILQAGCHWECPQDSEQDIHMVIDDEVVNLSVGSSITQIGEHRLTFRASNGRIATVGLVVVP